MKDKIFSVEPPTTNPERPPAFYVTWETTLKCNLDCSYCGKDGHDNTQPHPPLHECKKTIDFLVEYLDIYMNKRPPAHRHASINIFGGESLIQPGIVDILDYFEEKHKPYKDKWSLGLNTVTNAIVKEKLWNRVVDKFEFWTVSYHTESTQEQQDLFRRNVLDLKRRGKRFHVSILLHTKHWDNCMHMIEWCKENNVPYLPRQIDHPWTDFRFYYTPEQARWIHGDVSLGKIFKSAVNMSAKGRECCGGCPLHVDQDYDNSVKRVNNKFKTWSCGVNYFFVFIKQNTKEIFTNKDCRVGFNSKPETPLGHLDNYQELLDYTREHLEQDTLPIIQCPKKACLCGICAPKAASKEKFKEIFEKFTNA